METHSSMLVWEIPLRLVISGKQTTTKKKTMHFPFASIFQTHKEYKSIREITSPCIVVRVLTRKCKTSLELIILIGKNHTRMHIQC